MVVSPRMAALLALVGLAFRFLAYTFLRWIPAHQATYGVPALFLVLLLAFALDASTRSPVDVTAPAQEAVVAELDVGNLLAIHEPGTEPVHANGSTLASRAETPTAPAGSDVGAVQLKSVAMPPKRRPTAGSACSRITALVCGSPSSSSSLNIFSMLVNSLLLLACLDLLWTPILFHDHHDLAFSRVGSVTHSSVKLFARIPPSNETGDVDFAGARVAMRPTRPLGKWNVLREPLVVDETRDWTGVLEIAGLYSATEYEVRLLLPSTSDTAQHPSFPAVKRFTTAPDPALFDPKTPEGGVGTLYTFASSSCIKPNFPYRGPFEHGRIEGARYLKKEIEEAGVKFLLFLGDFIYADVPYYPGSDVALYQKRYRQVFASPDWEAVTDLVPVVAIYDDHEIYNDFSSSSDDPRFAPANSAFRSYLGSSNPMPVTPDVNYFEYRYGDSAFFVLDTRAYRSPNDAPDDADKTMLGTAQKAAFLSWLSDVNQTVTWKFVVSSTPMMSLWAYGEQDTWAGFLTEREELLDVLESVPNVIVLSGDRHEFAAATLRNSVTEFSTSPLNQFYLPIRTLSQSNGKGATGEDVLLKYIPDGNSKFSTFEVDTTVRNKPVVRVKVIVDGEEAWRVEVQGKQLDIPPLPTTVGSLGRSLMELLGFSRRSWF